MFTLLSGCGAKPAEERAVEPPVPTAEVPEEKAEEIIETASLPKTSTAQEQEESAG